jgi:hypothetical protein
MEPEDFLAPVECDWCQRVYEYGDGGVIAGDDVCLDCLQHDKEIQ